MLERRLYLSKAAPLEINLHLDDSEEGMADIQKLLEHRNRWRRLKVIGPIRALRFLLQHLEQETPILEHLGLKGLPDRATVDITKLSAPRLETLQISFHVIHVAARVLAKLRHLRLASSCYSTSKLHQMLVQCELLTVLELERIEIGLEEAANTSPILPPIKLPKLTHMDIREADSSTFLPLLRLIDAPLIQSVTFLGVQVETSRRRPEVIYNKEGFPNLMTHVLKANMSSRRMVWARDGELHISLRDVINFKYDYYERDGACATLTRAISVFQLDTADVSLDIGLGDGDPVHWRRFFETIRLVSLYAGIIWINDLQWFCDYLGQSTSVCPHLTHLRILPRETVPDRAFTDRDAEGVVPQLLRNRKRLVVELGEFEVFNPSTGKFQKKAKDGHSWEGATEKGTWKFAF